jgi:hypothetical protein
MTGPAEDLHTWCSAGDIVLLKTKYFGFCRKFAPRWLGLLQVLEVLQPYRLAVHLELQERAMHVHPVFHVSLLRSYYASGFNQPPALPAYVDGELEHEVDYVASTGNEGKKNGNI